MSIVGKKRIDISVSIGNITIMPAWGDTPTVAKPIEIEV